jgi:hypothetical protein
MRVWVIRLALAATALAIGLACGPRELPAPRYTSQPTSALVEVPYPPPPARIETVPPRPDVSGSVWIDGEWTWLTRRWAWKPGRWVSPPSDARFAPWTTVRDRAGTLYFATGAWRTDSGAEVAEPKPLATSGPAPAVVVTPEGEEVKPGPNAPLDAGPSAPAPIDDAGAPDESDGGMIDAGSDQ